MTDGTGAGGRGRAVILCSCDHFIQIALTANYMI